MPKVYTEKCRFCEDPFTDFSKSRLASVVANHEMICESNPHLSVNRERDRHGPDLETALKRARKELGDW